jgi:cytochrome c biogenesis protein CcmG, thiol:disulfide interchange protein DsbE
MMLKRLPYLLPLAVFAGIAVYLWIGLGHDPRILPSALLDKPAPEFNLPPLEGRARLDGKQDALPLATKHLATGKPILVNFFASWCGPCQVEHPILNQMATMHGVTIHGINYKDDPARALAFLGRLGDTYDRVGRDQDGRLAIDFGVYGIPETFVIDGKGRVRYRHPGPIDPATAEQILALLESLK